MVHYDVPSYREDDWLGKWVDDGKTLEILLTGDTTCRQLRYEAGASENGLVFMALAADSSGHITKGAISDQWSYPCNSIGWKFGDPVYYDIVNQQITDASTGFWFAIATTDCDTTLTNRFKFVFIGAQGAQRA